MGGVAFKMKLHSWRRNSIAKNSKIHEYVIVGAKPGTFASSQISRVRRRDIGAAEASARRPRAKCVSK
jgi:hypothetical protein